MKAEELAAALVAEYSGDELIESIAIELRSYGLACAMKERERCIEVANLSALHHNGVKVGTGIAARIRSRPVGDALMKEIEG